MTLRDKAGGIERDIQQEIAAAEERILGIVRCSIAQAGASSDDFSSAGGESVVDVAKAIVARRRIRRKHFSAELFHERAWDMLLELFVAHTTDREVWVKSLLSAADGSPTTAIRWLDHLEAKGLLVRRADSEDRRRVIVNLTEKGENAMLEYLQEARSLM